MPVEAGHQQRSLCTIGRGLVDIRVGGQQQLDALVAKKNGPPQLSSVVISASTTSDADTRCAEDLRAAEAAGKERVRVEATKLTRLGASSLGTAHILELGGLRGVAVRGFLNTMLLLARSKTPQSVHASIDAAMPAMLSALENGPRSWTHAEVTEALRAARALTPPA